MKSIKYLILGFAAIAFAACNSSSFEQVVTYDIPEEAPKLVTYAEFTDADTTFRPMVGRSVGINSKLPVDSMKDAKMSLYKNNNLIMSFNSYYDKKKNSYKNVYFYKNSTTVNNPFSDDADYKLKVEYAPYKTIESTIRPPQKVDILGIEYNPLGFTDVDGDKSDEALVEFLDPPGENFYKISVSMKVKDDAGVVSYKTPFIKTTTSNSIFGGGDSDLSFNDETFNGGKHKFRMGLEIRGGGKGGGPGGPGGPGGGNNNTFTKQEVVVRLISISKEAYYFERSVSQYKASQDNLFGAEPTQVNTNFVDGYGYFRIGRVAEKILKF